MSETSPPHLAILHTIARKLSSSVHLEQILQITLSQVAELLELETGWVFLLDHEDRFYLAASQNLPPGLAADPARMTGWCQCQEMFRHDELHSGQNISIVACSRLNQLTDPVQTGGLRFHASIPLKAGEQRLGVMNAASRQKQALNQDELHTLYTIGDLLSLAIQRTRYYEEHLNHSALSERYRLARELHDSLGQGLAALILRLETLDALVDMGAEADRLKPQINASVELARRTLREARSSVQQLRSEAMGLPELAGAIERLIGELLPELEVKLDIDQQLQLSPALSHSLYRMLQELLNNVRKHAAARQLRITLCGEAGGLRLKLEDDGAGFEPDAVREGHFGLIGLRERVHLLAGQLQIRTSPGHGTLVEIFLPGDLR
ncbi:MAG: histidine kinase [Candidatus Sericytochromatia bacterium]